MFRTFRNPHSEIRNRIEPPLKNLMRAKTFLSSASARTSDKGAEVYAKAQRLV
jgi:hypothetical protein